MPSSSALAERKPSILSSSKSLGDKRKLQVAAASAQAAAKQKASIMLYKESSKKVVGASPERVQRTSMANSSNPKSSVEAPAPSSSSSMGFGLGLRERRIVGTGAGVGAGLKKERMERSEALSLLGKRTAEDALLMRQNSTEALVTAASSRPAKLSSGSRDALASVAVSANAQDAVSRPTLATVAAGVRPEPAASSGDGRVEPPAQPHTITTAARGAAAHLMPPPAPQSHPCAEVVASVNKSALPIAAASRLAAPSPPAVPSTGASASHAPLFKPMAKAMLPSTVAGESSNLSTDAGHHSVAKAYDQAAPYENFVRKNLNKSSTTYKKMQADPRYNRKVLSKDFRNGEAGKITSSSSSSDAKGGGGVVPAKKGPDAAEAPPPPGFASTGMDALQLTLDAMTDGEKGSTSAAAPAARAGVPGASVGGNKTKPSLESLDISTLSSRGKKTKQNPHGLTDDFFEKYAPLCTGHQMGAKMLVVKKAGPNKNRRFYGCCFSADQRCKFFMWAEDNPEVLPVVLELNKRKQERNESVYANNSAGEAAVTEKLDPYDEWKRNAVGLYMERLDGMTVGDLKAEILRCKKRRLLTMSASQQELDNDPSLVKLTLGGHRADVIQRLGKEAMRVLERSRPTVDSEGGSCSASDMEVIFSKTSTATAAADVLLDSDSNSSSDCDDIILDSESAESSDAGSADESPHVSKPAQVRRQAAGKGHDKTDMLAGLSPLTRALVECFGFSSFRQGQKWAVQRALDGKNSLLVMPTGAGKSLCYMLPAALLPGLTLVVSPLISLMQDQLRKLPVQLPGACFGGGMTVQEVAALSALVMRGHIKVLFVSPEKLCTLSFRNLMKDLGKLRQSGSKYMEDMTDISNPISLVCIDEAHCMSQWSYNFRPAFLRIRKEIAHLRPRAIMALTATAPPHIQTDIMEHLRVPAKDGLCALPPRRMNLVMHSQTIEMEMRQSTILGILKDCVENAGFDSSKIEEAQESFPAKKKGFSKRKQAVYTQGGAAAAAGRPKFEKPVNATTAKEVPCTIIYVWRRDETVSLCEYLQASGFPAVAYHAGMDADQRNKSQQAFDKGTAKIVIATTAFGMGVDKADVRQVIHCSLPKSVENYLQETGRAGRDGERAACHLLMCEEDLVAQHSLSHSNRLSEIQVATLLSKVFVQMKSTNNQRNIRLKVPVSLKKVAELCDIADATVETILSVLELPPYAMLLVDGVHLDTINGSFKMTADKLAAFGKTDIIVNALVELNEVSVSVKKNPASFKAKFASEKGNTGSFFKGHPMDTVRQPDEDEENSCKKPLFCASLLALAERTGLDRAEAARGLWMLQTRGILEYTLTDACVYVSLTSKGQSLHGYEEMFQVSKDGLTAAQCTQMNFCSWLFQLAQQVAKTINDIEIIASQRSADVWRVGHMMIESSKDAEEDALQARVSDFLCFYMDQLSGMPHSDRRSTYAEGGDQPQDQNFNKDMFELFMSTALPVLSVENVGEEQKQGVSAQLQCVVQDARNLAYDSELRDIITKLEEPWNSFLKKLPPIRSFANAESSSHDTCGSADFARSISQSRTDLLALYVSKVMHGLNTPIIGEGAWKSNIYWAKYKSLDFQAIYTALCGEFSVSAAEEDDVQNE